LDNDNIKNAIMNYGEVYTTFKWTGSTSVASAYYNPKTGAYYNNADQGVNQAVTIIGWDDKYSASAFSTKPPGKGAYLCKNSLGSLWGKSGYFWVSYYDVSMGYVENAVLGGSGLYARHYQYDPFGHVTDIGMGSETIYAGNIFTATAGTLKAVGFHTTSPGTQYTIYVYKNPTADNPTAGTLASVVSGITDFSGYHTRALWTAVPLTAGEKFSVVIKYTTPGNEYPCPIQYWVEGYNDAVPPSVPGQSFVRVDGVGTWIDLATSLGTDQSAVANIQAFST
jgi:hypothetical protein